MPCVYLLYYVRLPHELLKYNTPQYNTIGLLPSGAVNGVNAKKLACKMVPWNVKNWCFIIEWNDHEPARAQPEHEGLQPGAHNHMSRLVHLGGATWHVYCMCIACMWIIETLLHVSQSGKINAFWSERTNVVFLVSCSQLKCSCRPTVHRAVFSITQLTVSATFCL